MTLRDEILAALRANAGAAGMRVSELCAGIAGRPLPAVVMRELELLAAEGAVRRDGASGRWIVVSRARVGAPAPPLPPPVTRPPPIARGGEPMRVSLPIVDDAGIPSDRDDDGIIDPSQREVIRDAASARQVVIAGPGFGKTAVACGRVAWLIRQGVAPSRILLLSFTRVAVREVRARIAELAQDVADAGAVDVRTIDSFAWRLRTGLSEGASDGRTYADNIDDTATMLRTPSVDVLEYLEAFEHVIVDEAQDLVGARARLVAQMLDTLRPDAGWTVFLDPAQAIYDWSEGDEDSGGSSETFVDLLARRTTPSTRRTLRHLHRTRDPALRALVLGARKLVLDPAAEGGCSLLRGALEQRAVEAPAHASDLVEPLRGVGASGGGLLVLTRRRMEVMELSARLREHGVPHRVRFGGLPRPAPPWIAAVLNEACQESGDVRVSRAAFGDAWDAVVSRNGWLVQGWEPEGAWRALRRMSPGSKTAVDVSAIARRVAARSLPDDLSRRDPGDGDLLLSTVHGSKGREASHALLLLTHQGEASAEEARVLYVGMSRAKERLDVRCFRASRWRCAGESKRAWRRAKSGRVQVEFGREGDLDLRRTLALGEVFDVHAQQGSLAAFDGIPRAARVVVDQPAMGWVRHVIDAEHGTRLMAVSSSCEDDLRAVARCVDKGARTPMSVMFLQWVDTGTEAVPGDAAGELRIPEPWRTTRLLLAPVVLGPGLLPGAPR